MAYNMRDDIKEVYFTEEQLHEKVAYTGYSRIDSTVRKIGGYYYRFTKNEQGGMMTYGFVEKPPLK